MLMSPCFWILWAYTMKLTTSYSGLEARMLSGAPKLMSLNYRIYEGGWQQASGTILAR